MTQSVAPMLSRRLVQFLAIDSGMLFGAAARIWSTATGVITVFLIAAYLSSETQGYYYTFVSLIALQVFFELGLGQVLIQFSSHEWSRLQIDECGSVAGDAPSISRLSSLLRFSRKWFGMAAILFFIGLLIAGFVSFHEVKGSVRWQAPWTVLSAAVAVDFGLLPYWSLLEGCNQIRSVYALRFMRVVVANLALWIAMMSHSGIWSLPVGFASGLGVTICALAWHHGHFLGSVLRASKIEGCVVSWWGELWPMQWRIAVSWLSGYFYFSLFTPVLFKFHGAVIAGQMGMTWTVISALGSLGSVLVQTKTPLFGVLIARRDWESLDHIALRVGVTALLVCVGGSAALFAVVVAINQMGYQLAHRLLPIYPFALFLMGGIAQQIIVPMAAYLRAHRREPLMWISLINGTMVGLSTVICGLRWGATGIGWGYFLVTCFISVPGITWIFLHHRKEWHI